MKYGYARVSTDGQSTALQLAALKRAGCKTVFMDGFGIEVGKNAVTIYE